MDRDQLPGSFFGPPNLVELVRRRAAHQPDATAFTFLIDGEQQRADMSYQELDRQARGIAAWLQSLGLRGERALLLYPPGLEFIAAFFGCLYADVVAVPVYPPRRNRSLERIQAIADDADARVALTTDVVLRRVEPLIDDTPHLKELEWLATCHVPEQMEQRWEMPDIGTDTLAFLQYTSGSTGTPKGVMLTHGNLLHNSALIAHVFEHTRSGVGVFWLPSYHDMGLIGGIIQPLFVGRPNILMSPMAFLQKPFRWLSAITRFGGTTSGGPNFAYELCVRKITPEQRAQLDLSTWQVAFNGAEPIREETIERFVEMFGPCGFRREAFFPCFGLAEATLIVSGGYAKKAPVIEWFSSSQLAKGRAEPASKNRAGSRALVGCGECLPDQRIVIADPEKLTECPEGQVGEVWVQGPSVAVGYWRQPEATEATFGAYLKDSGEGPFLRTGDLGFLYHGELFITGRIKDVIILRGVNLYPQDIELTVQNSHPWLRADSGAAFSVDDDGKQRLVVVQELERRVKGDFRSVIQAIRRAVSREHELALDAVVLVKAGSIPKTSSGKIQRHACRESFLSGTLRVMAQWHADRDGDQLPPLEEPCTVLEEQSHPATPATAVQNGPLPSAHADSPPGPPCVDSPAGIEQENSPRSPIEGTQPAAEEPPAVLAHRMTGTASGNGRTTADVVLELVQRAVPGRVNGLSLDSPITELGLDSVEKMELLAALETRFGGRFPEEVLPELETCRHVVEAVDRYLLQRRVVSGDGRPVEIAPEDYDPAQFPEYAQLRTQLEYLEQSSWGNPFFVDYDGPCGSELIRGDRQMINFAGTDYLGLSTEPAVVQAAKDALDRFGTALSSSRIAAGQRGLYRELEESLAAFLGTEAALVFPGTHATVDGILGRLFGPNDLIVYDAALSGSMAAGLASIACPCRPFAHGDLAAAEAILRAERSQFRRVLIVLEGLSALEGDLPDLPAAIALKQQYKAMLLVDQSHSLGTLGPSGRGIAEQQQADPAQVEIWTGTLGNALAGSGGYIAGSGALVQLLRHSAPGFVFDAGPSPADAAAALAAVQLVREDPTRVQQLRDRATWFAEQLSRYGLSVRGHGTPIVSLVLGNSVFVLRLCQALAERNMVTQPILYPAVAEEESRLRLLLTAAHPQSQLAQAAEAIRDAVARIGRNLHTPTPTSKASVGAA